MDYFEVVPVDLVEIIVSFLDKKDLGYFTDEYMHNYLIDWSHVHFHRYGFYGNFDKYVKYLAAEKMKKWVPERLGKMNLDQILDIKNLDLTGLHVKSLPDEISVLKNYYYNHLLNWVRIFEYRFGYIEKTENRKQRNKQEEDISLYNYLLNWLKIFDY